MSNDLTHLDQPSDLAHAAIRYKEAFIEVSHRAAQAAIARENMQLANCDAYEAFNADRQANFDADEEPPVSMGFTGQLSDQLGKIRKSWVRKHSRPNFGLISVRRPCNVRSSTLIPAGVRLKRRNRTC